jgi:hypothetical protein
MRDLAISIILAIALLGCEPPILAPPAQGPARSSKLNEPPRPMAARAPASVTLYQVQMPAEPFVEVVRITDLGDNENVALEALRRSAAYLGCDGLVLGSWFPESIIAGSVQRVSLAGTCIMFVRDPGTWRAPEAAAEEAPASSAAAPPAALPQDADECVAARAKVLAAKDPRERMRLIRSMPSKCHPR